MGGNARAWKKAKKSVLMWMQLKHEMVGIKKMSDKLTQSGCGSRAQNTGASPRWGRTRGKCVALGDRLHLRRCWSEECRVRLCCCPGIQSPVHLSRLQCRTRTADKTKRESNPINPCSTSKSELWRPVTALYFARKHFPLATVIPRSKSNRLNRD